MSQDRRSGEGVVVMAARAQECPGCECGLSRSLWLGSWLSFPAANAVACDAALANESCVARSLSTHTGACSGRERLSVGDGEEGWFVVSSTRPSRVADDEMRSHSTALRPGVADKGPARTAEIEKGRIGNEPPAVPTSRSAQGCKFARSRRQHASVCGEERRATEESLFLPQESDGARG